MRKIKIKRFDKSLPLPEYTTKGAAGFDFFARETVTIKPNSIGYIPINNVVEIPKGHFMILAARSSTHKIGLLPANGIGIIDSDFRGEKDESKMIYYNFTKRPVTVGKGTRIGQGVLVKFTKAKWQEVNKMNSKTRGGLGSTGNK